ncbi:N-formylglutamate amidohydrolase [uncultured Roseobacter sp.]|uniref:N-formylglutamate amidohydrolase n=1 Tax=uncultured Roseobacter sp. TaxID=114847 RepID=UPI00261BDE51|nr:N-formylglutamate amidohydrolase [uncultured Roseobacter sp.]
MTPNTTSDAGLRPAIVSRKSGASGIVLVCEHASNHIPAKFAGLGVSEDVRQSHVAWDPGALGVASRLSEVLDAALVAGGVSRLVYDCNRPPDAAGAMPTRSEVFDIPGNASLSARDQAARIADVYAPFRAAITETLEATHANVLITIHSFTPVYLGHSRGVQLGVLHDADARLADAILARAAEHTTLKTERNQPYGPQDGVTHTLKEHGVKQGLPNVMLEVRNDLIATSQDQVVIADMLAPWLQQAIAAIRAVEAQT